MDNIQERAEKIGNEVNGAKNDITSRFTQLKDKAEQTGQQVVDSAKTVAKEVRTEGKELADQICSQSSKSLENVREYVTNYPFRSIAAAVGVGLLVGYMRKRN